MHRGAPITIVALARKILAIIHHLLTNMEPYEEPGVNKRVRSQKVRERDEFSVSGAFGIIGMAENVTGNRLGIEGDGCG
jgi:hypothetical protein